MPRCSNICPAIKPIGPAPTTSTDTSISCTALLSDRSCLRPDRRECCANHHQAVPALRWACDGPQSKRKDSIASRSKLPAAGLEHRLLCWSAHGPFGLTPIPRGSIRTSTIALKLRDAIINEIVVSFSMYQSREGTSHGCHLILMH